MPPFVEVISSDDFYKQKGGYRLSSLWLHFLFKELGSDKLKEFFLSSRIELFFSGAKGVTPLPQQRPAAAQALLQAASAITDGVLTREIGSAAIRPEQGWPEPRKTPALEPGLKRCEGQTCGGLPKGHESYLHPACQSS